MLLRQDPMFLHSNQVILLSILLPREIPLQFDKAKGKKLVLWRQLKEFMLRELHPLIS